MTHLSCHGLALAWLLMLLIACTAQETAWHGKDISQLMPPLEFQLIDDQGERVTAADSAGRVRLLFFGYTHCPDVCPATLDRIAAALARLPEGLGDEVQVLFVSVDPQRDSPERLARYVDFFDPRIQGLSGSEPRLRALTRRYRTTFGYGDADAEGNYPVSHSNALYAFDRQGRARLLLRPDLGAQAISEDLARLAQEGSDKQPSNS